MKKFALQPGENLLINDPHAVWMKTETAPVDGMIKLTNKRFVFVNNAVPFLSMFMRSKRSHIVHEFPLEKIVSFSRKEHFKSVRIVIDNGIERPREFVTSKIDSIAGELKNKNVKAKE